MPRIFFYKLTSDANAAPCIKDDLLSLAICKPMIRCSAEEGDLIFGFAADSLHSDNRLIYIARVTKKLCHGEYYDSVRFRHRDDRIYKRCGGRFVWRRGALFHGPQDIVHDLGKPPDYSRAVVLLSTDFRYFGGSGKAKYKKRYSRIKQAIEGLGQGYRVNLDQKLLSQFQKLKSRTWKGTRRKVAGTKSNEPSRRTCYRSKFCGVVASSGGDEAVFLQGNLTQ